jgi:hypothetical protein
VFRALFGAVLTAAAVRFVAKGWLQTQLIDPPFHFTYPCLSFVRPGPAPLVYLHFALLIVAGIALAVGYRSKLSAAVLAFGWGWLELIDRATYLNHYYLLCLMACLLACSPAGRALSLDVRLGRMVPADTMPRWLLCAMRLQVGVVYVFAGFAKLNADWLLRAQPLRIWLAASADQVPWFGTWLAAPVTAFVASWLSAVFDLAIVPLLLWRRTRAVAFLAAIGFHAVTGLLLPIGMFPWIMLTCATLLLAPDWPRRWLAEPTSARYACPARRMSAVFAVHCAVQVIVPLHHHLFVQDSAWTSEGFDFAWKVMIAEKSGNVRFTAKERQTGRAVSIERAPALTPVQELALGRDPRLIIEFARHLAREVRARTGCEVAIFADAFASLNGRPAQRLIDPGVDLTRDPLPARAIVPLVR